ncbi:MAG: Calcium/proton exchanger [Gemmatimonadetes bacterium]|nr:Calcium/proton exchanger [Gemmatimonadota bacterium]
MVPMPRCGVRFAAVPHPGWSTLHVLKRNEIVVFGVTGVALIAAAVLHFSGASAILQFASSAIALSLLALNVSSGTEHAGAHLSPGATGILQSALGNLPEVLVCAFSLRAGLVQVVQGALIGSMLANSLLVLGLAILVGGVKHGRMHFDAEAPRMIMSLMVVAVAALAMPTLAHQLHTPAASHERQLSAVSAVLLLIIFVASLRFSLSSDPERSVRHAERVAGVPDGWPLSLAIAVLVAASIGAAVVSEWFVSALEPAIEALHISQAFAGIVVVAIAGNAVENVAGIRLMAKNRPDYAMSVILNSSLMIALVVAPALVLLSFVLGGAILTLVMPPLLIAALLLTTLISAIVVNDGEAIWLEGVALIGLYVIIAAAFWWG